MLIVKVGIISNTFKLVDTHVHLQHVLNIQYLQDGVVLILHVIVAEEVDDGGHVGAAGAVEVTGATGARAAVGAVATARAGGAAAIVVG